MATDTDKYSPTGNESIGYPQICIRTNRTAERTDLKQVIRSADEVAKQYPSGDKRRAKAVVDKLTSAFGGGGFGHSWIILFESSSKHTTYAYHDGFGYVKDGTGSAHNDSPERKFHLEYTVKLDDANKARDKIENVLVPVLNMVSAAVGYAISGKKPDFKTGAYTAINNCTWFAGNVWKCCIGEPLNKRLTYEQEFDGADHADNWCMPYLNLINEIADPGMLAETLAKVKTGS
ncbi:hypothetical protein IHE33_05330 [Mycetohabitans endofungorum]|uniref:hypothetical protein n=1 Tax=Mycetohabitans endofungorum TaxID=417203 RepID=UPI0030D282C8